MEHPELDPGCTPLVTFQEGYRAMLSGRVLSQARHLARNITPLATNRWNSLSRLGRITFTIGAGAFVWWLCFRLLAPKKQRSPPTPLPPRKRRVRTTSSSTWLASEASASTTTTSRPSYNWAELQRCSVSDQDSVVSGQTLVDGTQLAPQQLGLMGMEALETVIGYWEDALGAYSPASRQLVLTTAEETQFIRSIEEILELAYSLQESSEQLFIHQNSVLNRRAIDLYSVSESEATTTRTPSRGAADHKRQSLLSISTLEEVSFVSAQDTVADLRDFDDLGDELVSTDQLALYQVLLFSSSYIHHCHSRQPWPATKVVEFNIGCLEQIFSTVHLMWNILPSCTASGRHSR